LDCATIAFSERENQLHKYDTANIHTGRDAFDYRKIVTDVCMHTAYRIYMVVSLYMNSYHIILTSQYC